MTEWQPIETAPEGGFFLVCEFEDDDDYESSVSVVWRQPWDNGEMWAVAVNDASHESGITYYDGEPTHWMPLPKAPHA